MAKIKGYTMRAQNKLALDFENQIVIDAVGRFAHLTPIGAQALYGLAACPSGTKAEQAIACSMTPTQFSSGLQSAVRMMGKYGLGGQIPVAGMRMADDDDLRRGLAYRPKWVRFAFDQATDYCVDVDTLQVEATRDVAAEPDFDDGDVLIAQESRSFLRVLPTKHLLPSVVAINSNCSYLDRSPEVSKLAFARRKFADQFHVHVAGPASVHVVRLPGPRRLNGGAFYLTIVDLGGAYTPEKDKPRVRVKAGSRPAAPAA